MASKQLHPTAFIFGLGIAAPPRTARAFWGWIFKVEAAPVEESEFSARGPEWMVAHNAALKADAVAIKAEAALVLGSDTTVAVGDRVLGKPRDLEEAQGMLELLSGREHTVYTAVALRCRERAYAYNFVEASKVRFHMLDAATIQAYHAQVNPLDKAGAYGIQEGREMIIDSVTGSVENVMGLPIQRLAEILREQAFGFKLSSFE